MSSGAVMGAWFEPLDSPNTKVTVVTKRILKTNIAPTLTEGTFQRRFSKGVDIVRIGKPLSENPPNEKNCCYYSDECGDTDSLSF